ncbi:hypothetical protein DdX_12032 [Ditylenchus destructor]|uniref:Protein kinase domain-containing protein n=1 Tax=Ditylenchus destructor TaxID=166010 RepID=A0AAD4R412_9BILA|nr:hypothetical protein DdX_12032 [Ditylenchus destructor]
MSTVSDVDTDSHVNCIRYQLIQRFTDSAVQPSWPPLEAALNREAVSNTLQLFYPKSLTPTAKATKNFMMMTVHTRIMIITTILFASIEMCMSPIPGAFGSANDLRASLPFGHKTDEEQEQILMDMKESNENTKQCSIVDYKEIKTRTDFPKSNIGRMYLAYHKDNKRVLYMAEMFTNTRGKDGKSTLTDRTLGLIQGKLKLESKFAAKVICLGWTKDSVTLISEYAMGGTLEELFAWLDERREKERLEKKDRQEPDFDIGEINKYGGQLLLGMEYQPKGSDFARPDNIRLDMSGNLQLSNYILAKISFVLSDDTEILEKITDERIVDYSAPEIYDCTDPDCMRLDTKAINMFALGALIWRFYKGKEIHHHKKGLSYIGSRQYTIQTDGLKDGPFFDEKNVAMQKVFYRLLAASEKERREDNWSTIKQLSFFAGDKSVNKWENINENTNTMRYVPDKVSKFEDTKVPHKVPDRSTTLPVERKKNPAKLKTVAHRGTL